MGVAVNEVVTVLKSSSRKDEVLTALRKLSDMLPGPETPQKFSGVDETPVSVQVFCEHFYRPVTFVVLELVSPKWVGYSSGKKSCCVWEHLFLHGPGLEAVESLERVIHTTPSSFKLDVLVDLLEKVLKSGVVCNWLVQTCKIVADNSVEGKQHMEYDEMIQLVISIPERLANKLKINNKKTFVPDYYCKLVVYDVVCCVQFLIEAMKEGISCSLSTLSLLVSKMFMVFKSLQGMTMLIRIFEDLCKESFIARRIIQSVFSRLSARSIESACVLLLQHVADPSAIHRLLGTAVENSRDWKHVLCNKLIFFRFFKDEKVLKNLLGYLAVVQNDQKFLVTVLLKLFAIWGDSSAIQHTSVEQHLYLTKAIVISAHLLSESNRKQIKGDIQRLIIEGVPVHLASTVKDIRTMGMITSELIVNTLKTNEGDLKFDYDSDDDIVAQLKSLMRAQEDNASCESTGCMFNQLKVDLNIVCEEAREEGIKDDKQHDRRVANLGEEKEIEKEADVHEEDVLDSDDDLEPYDMSNDIKLEKTKKPAYLRDMMEGLLEQEDRDFFINSLEVCEELVFRQLHDDDDALAIEILQILLHVEDKFSMDGFEDCLFNSMVAVTITYPSQCAEYLCQQVFERNYSVRRRLDMLYVLQASAQELANVRKQRGRKETPRVTYSNVAVQEPKQTCPWKSVIEQRIESNTRRYHSKRKGEVLLQKNEFAAVSGHFFFPLVYSFNKNISIFDRDVILLTGLLNTLAIVMKCAVNTPSVSKLGNCLLDFVWNFRYHKEPAVRQAVIGALGSVVVSVPATCILNDSQQLFWEYHEWLMDVAEKDTDQGCRELAGIVTLLIRSVTQSEMRLDMK